MCFIWCLIDKAQLLISSEMNGKQLGKPTRQGRTLHAAASFLPQNGPNSVGQNQGKALLPQGWGWSLLPSLSSSPGNPGHHWGQAMPCWHQQHFGAACLAQVQCREPPPRPSAKHPPARAQPEMLQLPREGEWSWLNPHCPSSGVAGARCCKPHCGQ